MSKLFALIIVLILLISSGYSQKAIIFDRSQNFNPVVLNNSFFTAYYTVTVKDKVKVSFADVSLATGQIFTYKGGAKNSQDLQSLVLIEKELYNPETNKYEPCSEEQVAVPGVKYVFRLVLACMSSLAKAPNNAFLNANDIEATTFKMDENEVKNFKLRYENYLQDYKNRNIIEVKMPEEKVILTIPKRVPNGPYLYFKQ